MVDIRQLSECPEHLETVGRWIYEQWWRTPDNTPEVVLSLLRQHTLRDVIPYTVVALADDAPVGSCCVIENDCPRRPRYAPWVAAVFVKEEHRRKGIASAVLQEAFRVASRTGIDGLYIDCLLSTAPLYEKNGWRILEEEGVFEDSVILHRRAGPEPGCLNGR